MIFTIIDWKTENLYATLISFFLDEGFGFILTPRWRRYNRRARGWVMPFIYYLILMWPSCCCLLWHSSYLGCWCHLALLWSRVVIYTCEVIWLKLVETDLLKDGAYYCYCAYVLLISRYSDFLSPILTNTGIFLRGLKLSGESRSW